MISLEKELIAKAIADEQWVKIDDNYQYVVNEVERAKDKVEKELFHLQAQRFACKTDAQRALDKICKKLKYHQISDKEYKEHKVFDGKGRPKKAAKVKHTEWQINVGIRNDDSAIKRAVEQKPCFILASNIEEEALSPEEILKHYKAQSSVERGFRFLKDPLFFVSSLFIKKLFIKKPSRIDALLMIMTLSLLVYSIAQRRMRANMEKVEATIPNQLNQATATPTLRWVFQCFDGINLLFQGNDYIYDKVYLDGLTDLRQKIVRLIGGNAMHLYKIKKVA